jgi:hypothetical protein
LSIGSSAAFGNMAALDSFHVVTINDRSGTAPAVCYFGILMVLRMAEIKTGVF